MRFRRSARRRKADPLRSCPACRSPFVCPIEWEPSDDRHWWIALRCGECGARWEETVDDARAARYDIELDCDIQPIRRAVAMLDLARMADEADAFAAALAHDLIEPADFAA